MRQSWPDLPGVAIWPWPAGAALPIRIEPHDVPAHDPAAEAQWSLQCAANPRLFDGPILSVTGLIPGREIRVRRDSYKRLAVQPQIETGVEQLSVTGIVLARDAGGHDRVFLGRRGVQTRIYAGMWELGPSGGIDPPPVDRHSLCEGDLVDQLRREFAEETGFQTPLTVLRPHAICQDLSARSYDIVFVCRVEQIDRVPGPPIDPDRWEYDGLRWIDLSEVPQFDAEHDVIPPTRALFRHLGWAPHAPQSAPPKGR